MSEGDGKDAGCRIANTYTYYGRNAPLLGLLEDLTSLGRFTCGQAKYFASLPEFHVSETGPFTVPLEQEVQNQLQRLCQQEDQPELPADCTIRKNWRLQASLLAAASPGWDNTVRGLAQGLSKQLGVAHTACVEALLQKVSLVQEHVSFDFDTSADTPPGTFATMVLMQLPPDTSVQAKVCQPGEVLATSCNQAADVPCPASQGLGCFACFSGCTHELQVSGSGCYASMTYHLVHPPGSPPIVIKDEAWYLKHLRNIMDSQSEPSSGPLRSFYLFDHKYKVKQLHLSGLHKEHQQMAKLLHKAEQQGILDVYLVRVTHHEWLQIPQDRLGYPKCSRETDSEVTDSKTSIKDWRRLDGSKLAWKQELLRKQRVDCILQGKVWLTYNLEHDREEDDAVDEDDTMDEDEDEEGAWDLGEKSDSDVERYISFQRWKNTAGFVMWPCQKRWLVFCRQGVSAAYIRLRELIAKHTTLTVQTSVAAPAPDTDSGVAMLAAEPSQAEQELAACKQDIVSLIQAMYKQLKQKLHQETVPGYESFGDIALAFELPSLYEALLKDSLEGMTLEPATAQRLLHASKGLGWSRLCPFLSKLADTTTSGGRPSSEASLLVCWSLNSIMQILTNSLPGSCDDAADFTCEDGLASLNGIALCNDEAPRVRFALGGSEDAGMQAAVAATSIHLADYTRQWILKGKLPASAFKPPKSELSTKPWHFKASHQRGQAGSRFLPRRDSLTSMLNPVSDRERHVYADRSSLLVVAVKMFHCLIAKTRQAEISTRGLEEAICAVVDMYLASPQHFYVTDVLGHACIKIAEAQENPLPLIQSPAAIKLMAGCVQQLRQAVQLREPSCLQDRCTCSICQSMQTFLKSPEENPSHVVRTSADAQHFIEHLAPYADAEGHLQLQPAAYPQSFKCFRESDTDKLRRVEEANSMLATLQPVLNEMVFDLFKRSCKPPPEDHAAVQAEPEPEPEPQIVLYNLWQPVKPI